MNLWRVIDFLAASLLGLLLGVVVSYDYYDNPTGGSIILEHPDTRPTDSFDGVQPGQTTKLPIEQNPDCWNGTPGKTCDEK